MMYYKRHLPDIKASYSHPEEHQANDVNSLQLLPCRSAAEAYNPYVQPSTLTQSSDDVFQETSSRCKGLVLTLRGTSGKRRELADRHAVVATSSLGSRSVPSLQDHMVVLGYFL